MSTNPTNEHREQARALLAPWRIRLEHGDSRLPGLLADVIAEALSSRDAEIVVVCGDENKVGGCGAQVSKPEGFRCADCLAWFHRDCINKHFELDAYVKKLRELRQQGAVDDWKEAVTKAENALCSRDTQIREVLEGLAKWVSDDWCWCPQVARDGNGALIHFDACIRTSALYAKLQGISHD